MSNRLTKSEINTLKIANKVQIKDVVDTSGIHGFSIFVDGMRLLTPVYWTEGAINRSIKRIRPDIDISYFTC